jgi:hypothetical protein
MSDLARGLVARGHDVDLYCASGSEVPGVRVVDTGVDPSALAAKLQQTFQQRKEQHAYKVGMETATNIPEDQRIEKTVFVKAPRALKYGDVVKVIDAIKGAGANPVGLQVDDLP